MSWLSSGLLALCITCLSIAATAADQLFEGKSVPSPHDRLHVQQQRSLIVTTAVPSAGETREIFGADLYKKNIQPVWIQVENQGDKLLFLTPMGLDPDYFTARETANRSRSTRSELSTKNLEHKGLTQLQVPPHSIQSGYIFTRVDEGTKSFNVDVMGDTQPYRMSFFVPIPGLKLDHYRVDLPGLYPDAQLQHVSLDQLVEGVETLPCCVRNRGDNKYGDPLNLVLVGEIRDIHYAFMRAGWDETETIHGRSLLKTLASALSSSQYRYSPVSALYVFGRPQDVAFQRIRSRIHERNHLRLWLTPMRLEGTPVWVGQISRDIGVRFTTSTITTHKIDPDVDETREFLLEDMVYAQSVSKFGYVAGVGSADYTAPRGNLTGDPYFTDGRRVVMWISGEPVSMDEIEILSNTPFLPAKRPQ